MELKEKVVRMMIFVLIIGGFLKIRPLQGETVLINIKSQYEKMGREVRKHQRCFPLIVRGNKPLVEWQNDCRGAIVTWLRRKLKNQRDDALQYNIGEIIISICNAAKKMCDEKLVQDVVNLLIEYKASTHLGEVFVEHLKSNGEMIWGASGFQYVGDADAKKSKNKLIEICFKRIQRLLSYSNSIREAQGLATTEYDSFLRSATSMGFPGIKKKRANNYLSCFANALIHALYVNPVLHYYLQILQNNSNYLYIDRPHMFHPLICNLKRNFQPDNRAEARAFLPLRMQEELHDGGEALGFCFDSIDVAKKESWLHHFFQKLFRIGLKTKKTCSQCETVFRGDEVFNSRLSFGIEEKVSVVGAIAGYSETEQLTGANQYACSVCSAKTDATKKDLFSYLPPSLSLSLKRFGNGVPPHYLPLKVSAPISIDEELDFGIPPLSNCVSPDSKLSSAPGPAKKYLLYAVVCQEGDTQNGHYVVYVRGWDKGSRWCKFNDLKQDIGDIKGLERSEVLEEDPLDVAEPDPKPEDRKSKNPKNTAYYLFYRRSDLWPK